MDVSRLSLDESDREILKRLSTIRRLVRTKEYSTPEAAWLAVLWNKVHRRVNPPEVIGNALGCTEGVGWTPPLQSSPREFTLEYSLGAKPAAGALALSCLFGLITNRLWICRHCQRPFARQSNRPRQTTCDKCLHTRVISTAANLSPSIGVPYTRLRKRLALRVHRKSLRTEERKKLQDAALRDARLVDQKKLSLDEWLARYDKRERRGRRPTGDTKATLSS